MSLYAVENVEEAFGVTREFLTPIGIRRWLKLAFIVFFVGSGVSFPTVQFNTSTPTGDVSNGDIPFNAPVNVPVDIVTLIVALVVAGVLLGALFALIGAIMEFVLIESLRTGEVSIRRYWSRRWRQGLRLFVFRVAIGLPILALVAGWLALLVAPIVTGSDPTVPLTAFFVGIPVVFLISVLYALVSGLTTVFVVPLMVQTDDGVLAAWGRLWGSIKAAWKQYLAYVVIAFLLTIAAGIIASIAIGLVAFVLWWGRNAVRGETETPSPTVMWIAIVASAVAFGVGHLPALASTVELTTALIVRTIVLNAIAGVGLGWLFWRRSLETAMIAHATFHVVLVGVSVVAILLS